jgi:signal transduction histidine kinase
VVLECFSWLKPGNKYTKFPIKTDYDKLKQVFLSLIANAIKYTEKGTIRVYAQKARNLYIFSVSDTGIGIPKTEQDKIFERFFRGSNTRKETVPGTGLGLSIVKELIELLDGEIWVESNPDEKPGEKGSVFSFSINSRETK